MDWLTALFYLTWNELLQFSHPYNLCKTFGINPFSFLFKKNQRYFETKLRENNIADYGVKSRVRSAALKIPRQFKDSAILQRITRNASSSVDYSENNRKIPSTISCQKNASTVYFQVKGVSWFVKFSARMPTEWHKTGGN